MGKSYTPTYRVEYRDQGGWHWMGWSGGRASQKNVDGMRENMNQSFSLGGVNESVSRMMGYVIHISELRLVRQRDNKVMYTSKAPMFEVV